MFRRSSLALPLLIFTLTTSVEAWAQPTTFKIDGEVTSFTHVFNPLLGNAIPLVATAPSRAFGEELGLESFLPDLSFFPDGRPPAPAEPLIVPVQLTVTIDLSDPVTGSDNLFLAQKAVDITVGDNQFFYDELTVSLSGLDMATGIFERLTLVPGVVEPLPPLEFASAGVLPDPSSRILIDPSMYLSSLPTTATEQDAQAPQPVSQRGLLYLDGTLLDNAIGFQIVSAIVVPEPAAASLAFAGAIVFLSRRRRALVQAK